jgi:hypothetical protein
MFSPAPFATRESLSSVGRNQIPRRFASITSCQVLFTGLVRPLHCHQAAAPKAQAGRHNKSLLHQAAGISGVYPGRLLGAAIVSQIS